MEEKKRYEYFFGTNTIKDNINKEFLSYKRVIDTLNQQDKRIKELEQENLSLQEQSIRDNQNWIEETTQLKQQLHDLPKKIVEEIQDNIEARNIDELEIIDRLANVLDTILKKYGGEDE